MQLNRKLWNDIRFWILLAFVVRLFGITNPPLEVGHNWRQTTVAMVARNFHEVDNNIFYPRVDMAGEKTGITGMEFPIYNYMIYGISILFGYDHWYGRLLNLMVSSCGIWFFYLLIRKYFKENVAFPATILLLVSIWFQYSRKIMPDTFSTSFIIIGIYYGTQYLDFVHRRFSLIYLLMSAACISVGVLAKLPSGFMLVVFVLFVFDRSLPFNRRFIFSLASLVALLPAALWYFLWVPHLVDSFGFWHFFMGEDIVTGCRELIQYFPKAMKIFYAGALKYTGFVVFVMGLFSIVKTRNTRLTSVFFLSTVSFLFVIIKAGRTFAHHDYYIIPFVPVMALTAAYGLSIIKMRTWANVLLIAISMEGIANQQHDFFIRDKEKGILQLESDLDKVCDRTDLILINSGNYPTPLYFAHRKGWVMSNAEVKDLGNMDSLACHGLKYVVILKRTFGSEVLLDSTQRVVNSDDYTIYRLR